MATLGQHAMLTLLLMTRDLFPHDQFDVQYYAAVVDDLDRRATNEAAIHQVLAKGVAQLDAALGTPWIALDVSVRRKVLHTMETTGFFTMVRSSTISVLYGNPLVYTTFGYGGPSVQSGGYIDRGFDDINWLPET